MSGIQTFEETMLSEERVSLWQARVAYDSCVAQLKNCQEAVVRASDELKAAKAAIRGLLSPLGEFSLVELAEGDWGVQFAQAVRVRRDAEMAHEAALADRERAISNVSGARENLEQARAAFTALYQ